MEPDMRIKEDYDKILKVGDQVKFHSGNFSGLTGIIKETDWNSTHPRALYGYYHTVQLSNGETGYIEKSEHTAKFKEKAYRGGHVCGYVLGHVPQMHRDPGHSADHGRSGAAA